MSTDTDQRTAKPPRVEGLDTGAAPTEQDHDHGELICSPWMGLHYGQG